MRKFIVKVQVPIETNCPKEEIERTGALVYNRERSIEGFLPIDKALLEAMGGEPKKFFHAHMEGTILHLDEEAPWQSW